MKNKNKQNIFLNILKRISALAASFFIAFALVMPMLSVPVFAAETGGNDPYKCGGKTPYWDADENDGKGACTATRPEVGGIEVRMDKDNKLETKGLGRADSGTWTAFFAKYRTVIVGISGIGAITMIALFIFQFMKLGSSAGNPQARQMALTGVLWTGIAAAGLGAVAIIAGFFYNAI